MGRFANIKFHTMKFILLSILFLGVLIKGILTDYPFPDSQCSTQNCYEITGCNNGKMIGMCSPFKKIPAYPCLCDKKPVKDCWDGNKCMLDKHCGKNGKCILYGEISGPKPLPNRCRCNVSEKECRYQWDCKRPLETCIERKCRIPKECRHQWDCKRPLETCIEGKCRIPKF